MNETAIQEATLADVMTIHRLANEIWWPTYHDLLPHGQIKLMLELMYSESALLNQLKNGQQFALAMRDETPVGFVGFQIKPDSPVTRIEKLYVLPSEQGKGSGKRLINYVAALALATNTRCLELNVYRHNPAKAFYERQGFRVVAEVKIPYHGYTLKDYVMQKPLSFLFGGDAKQ
ncbi:GNAT family N-acetyltransferase [Parapedobacter indicus]|uniref:Ribosomal protein S18 acetylase RimI n=1 Tax=Parapedobacter indicus TaxID=1477437 RepID=A0A1I3KPL0_9SPHI|nr:GNAT family N-acetyltransferase [Parapedobacter indicus]PPL01884.1 ribosomal protein S18 acetylase RimI-like enzyme [Parapedobacter indicus]SFI74406.1 Ribosomal protein S18 acetylase RimI [Parapedobacter indicus]